MQKIIVDKIPIEQQFKNTNDYIVEIDVPCIHCKEILLKSETIRTLFSEAVKQWKEQGQWDVHSTHTRFIKGICLKCKTMNHFALLVHQYISISETENETIEFKRYKTAIIQLPNREAESEFLKMCMRKFNGTPMFSQARYF